MRLDEYPAVLITHWWGLDSTDMQHKKVKAWNCNDVLCTLHTGIEYFFASSLHEATFAKSVISKELKQTIIVVGPNYGSRKYLQIIHF